MGKKIKFSAQTGKVGSTVTDEVDIEDCGYTDEEWEELSVDTKESIIQDVYDAFMMQNVDALCWVEDE